MTSWIGPSLSRDIVSLLLCYVGRFFEPTQVNSGVKAAIGAENVHVGFAIVTLVGLVNLGLGQHNQASPVLIPLELNLVALEKGLLRDWQFKGRHIENLDSGWLTLAFRDEDSHGQVLAGGSQGKIGDTLSAKLSPDGAEIV